MSTHSERVAASILQWLEGLVADVRSGKVHVFTVETTPSPHYLDRNALKLTMEISAPKDIIPVGNDNG